MTDEKKPSPDGPAPLTMVPSHLLPEPYGSLLAKGWPKDWARAYMKSPELELARDIMPNIDIGRLESIYGGNGKIGGPPEHLLALAGILFYQMAYGLTDGEMQSELHKNMFLREAIGNDASLACVPALSDFRNEVAKRGLLDAIFNPLTESCVKSRKARSRLRKALRP
ncbi:MAG: transposase [Deltaproteobacteria bacterium]|jgi:hypothetical protein|nr:transposase [Deltaproteobacteria bacterium]